MSDVVPSFFPTPHEIAGGLRWMREHPVVATAAAAAATAVSVLTYLKSRAEDEHELTQQQTQQIASKSLAETPSRKRLSTWSDSDEDLQATAAKAASAQVATSTVTTETELLLAAKQRRRGDTHGSDEVYSATESEVSTSSPTVRRSHPSSLSVNNFAFSCFGETEADGVTTNNSSGSAQPSPSANTNAAAGCSTSAYEVEDEAVRALTKDVAGLRFGFPESVLEEDEENSASPQWGWYVSTTPPDEYYT